jgi:copper chaperone CopZ
MKRIIIILAFTLAAASVNAQFTGARLQATGLTCAMCTNAIHKALEKLPYIETVKADIKNSAFDLKFREGSSFQIDELKEAVEDAGFSVGKLEMQARFDQLSLVSNRHFEYAGMNFHFTGSGSHELNGDQMLTILDRDFVTAKAYRKLSQSVKAECYAEGKAAECCVKEGMESGERVYHVSFEQ